MDDRRIGLVIRALRRRRGWRQVDLGAAGRVSQTTISAVERGHLEALSMRTLRRILGAIDARLEPEIRWRGGQLDRLLDEDHASLVGRGVDTLRILRWEVAIEVTYSVYGERGSIDILAFHPPTRSLLVIEVKTALTSVEELLRRQDEKVRLASQVARERFGWLTETTSQVLVIAEGRAARNRVARTRGIFEATLPATTREIRRWLKSPSGSIRGRWFMPITDPRAGIRRSGGRDRVRTPTARRLVGSPRSTRGPIDPAESLKRSPQAPVVGYQHGGR
ncbi:MAG: helix-turn-helix domain-containing protein [Candidatus Limnocylindrales bacterium]